MREFADVLSSDGKVTIPAEAREHLAISAGTNLVFTIEDSGVVTFNVPRSSTIASLRGAAGALARPRSWQEMREIGRADALARETRRAA
jgi:AbrB family looped-hinge helix DNA binding protein